jgi:hypothetical protein
MLAIARCDMGNRISVENVSPQLDMRLLTTWWPHKRMDQSGFVSRYADLNSSPSSLPSYAVALGLLRVNLGAGSLPIGRASRQPI